MTKFKIVVKKDCYFCDKLLEWLSNKDVDYKEIDYLDPNVKDSLVQNETFNSIYCDMSACVESIPIVVKDDEKFYYGELWDLVNNELDEEKAKEIFEL
ncbi:MAG: hypothetical protein GF383_12010 [Candidatus Lokiarchaeota archaeon]|nr:hypothetical protein [Candidatus Lokiarchaeota archaeon]MBD3341610.1 hypothetical protein [Candidatus Lokiarchaeota archaeon]